MTHRKKKHHHYNRNNRTPLENAALFALIFCATPALAKAHVLTYAARLFNALSGVFLTTLNVTETGSYAPKKSDYPYYNFKRHGNIQTFLFNASAHNDSQMTGLIESCDFPFDFQVEGRTEKALRSSKIKPRVTLEYMKDLFDCFTPERIGSVLSPFADTLMLQTYVNFSTCWINTSFNFDNVKLIASIHNLSASGCTLLEKILPDIFETCSAEVRSNFGFIMIMILAGIAACLLMYLIGKNTCEDNKNGVYPYNKTPCSGCCM